MSRPSLRARFMNAWLRLTEKRHLARVSDVKKLRRSFETKARMSFFGPRSARYDAAFLGNTPALRVSVSGVGNLPVILYFHGGGYMIGSPRTHRAMVATLCKRAGTSAIMPDYRKAPEFPFPAAFDDALAAYEQLLSDGIAADQIILGGDSAGGGLALALLGEICRRKLAQPRALFAFSPLTDLSFKAPSIAENAEADVVLPISRLEHQQNLYLQGHDPFDPRCSPINADFSGACPVWLCAGDTEILRDDSVLLAERLRAQGVETTLTIEQDLPHVWPLFHTYIPEASRSLRALAAWLKAH